MTLSEQLKNQKEQNAKIVGENFKLNQKVEKFENEVYDINYNLENANRNNQRLVEKNTKLQGEIIAYEKVIRILTNKENNTPF
jgi:predicted nuclease with TOPRIM domain